jgi:hypothetical protein
MRRAFAFACAALLAAPAAAQTTGTRMGGSPAGASSTRSPDAVRRLLVDYAGCVIKEGRSTVEIYLASPPESEQSNKLWGTIALDRCLAAGELTLSDAGFRAGAYEKLYRLDFGEEGPVDLAGRAEIDYAQGLNPALMPARYTMAVRGFADCMVRAAPLGARTLVLSRIGSSGEDKALAALKPSFGPCLPKDSKVSFSKGALRGLVAEALYRLSKAPPAPAVGETRQ